jgi:serine/threonine-protein kinase
LQACQDPRIERDGTRRSIRVVIAEDTALLREGLARLLVDAGVEVVGVAGDVEEVLRLVWRERPDVAILDIRMPPTQTDEGLVAAATIRERYPGTGVLVLSQYVEAGYALRLVEQGEGHCGYLLKESVLDAAELVGALERICAGDTVVDRVLVEQLLRRPRDKDPLAELTPREREVLTLMAEGLSDRGIAERLWLTLNTVETHVRHILQKLNLPTGTSTNRRVQAVLAYLRR